jgi:acyl dehydratase
MQFGRYLEEFEVGDVYKHWPGKTITQAEDILFCSITMNQHPAHSDDNYATAASPTGRAMVVGNLVYSLVLGQSVADVSGRAIANLEVEQLVHANPTFHGDTIYSESEVLHVRESSSKPDRGVVSVKTIGYKQDGTVVCEFSRKVLVPTRAHAGDSMPGRPRPQT